VESILRREAAPLCWHLSVFSRSDLAPLPGEAVAGREATDIKSLFEEFVAARSYEGDFGARFAERGRRALDDAMHALEASTVDEGAA
jgi:hypothetical protein